MSSATPGSRNMRKTLIGFVTSRSGDKSVKVTIPYKTPHPLYHKVINRKTVVHVHDEKNETKVGDRVKIMETRPLEPPEALAGHHQSSKARPASSPRRYPRRMSRPRSRPRPSSQPPPLPSATPKLRRAKRRRAPPPRFEASSITIHPPSEEVSHDPTALHP